MLEPLPPDRTTMLLICAVLTSVSCSSSQLGGRSQPVPHRPVTLPNDSANRNPLVAAETIYDSGQLEYLLKINAVVQTIPPDTLNGSDSTQIVALATVSFQRVSAIGVNVIISTDSVRQSNPGRVARSLVGQDFHFTINPNTGRLAGRTTEKLDLDCRLQPDAPFSGLEALPQLTSPIRATWADTSQFSVCRGGVALIFYRLATYQLNSVDTITQVIRSSRITITGSGSQWGQPVNVTGTGTAMDTLVVNGDHPPRIDSIDGTSHLDMQFHTPIRSQRFQQIAETHIVRKRLR